jgi:hypothetical protein
MMMVSVILAFLRVSSRKAITPLLTASTPVMAVHPEEKTLSISHQPTHLRSPPESMGSGVTGNADAPRVHHLPGAHGDHDQQRCRKHVGGNHEHDAGVVHAAHVHDGENEPVRSRQSSQRVRLQTGHSGDQRAHAGRNANGRSQYVVDHQRRRRQQSRALAQVLAGHRVGSAARADRPQWSAGS